jgi:ketosteroid isomerase-like protein
VKMIVTFSGFMFSMSNPSRVGTHGSLEKERAEILDIILQHDDALNQQNLDKLMALYAPRPQPVILETGAGERYQGRDEIRTAYTDFFKDFDRGTLSRQCYWKDGDVSGNTAWAAAQCKFTDSHAKATREYEINLSASLQRSKDRWQFTMLHLSQPLRGKIPVV